MSNLITTQINQLAERFDLPQSAELYQVLKATAFKGEVTDAQLSALLIVAKQYGLNPWTKEIYAFPDKGGIVPVVGVDGWSRIINSNVQFDGMDFAQDADSCTCVIYRKDRNHPIKVTEWMAECLRPPMNGKNGPWQSHPYRMLRHKAMIQCARIAFGFGGIYDQDEAERIIESSPPAIKAIDPATGEIKPSLPTYTDEQFQTNLPKWRAAMAAGKLKPEGVIAKVSTVATLTDDQIDAVKAIPAELVKEAGQRKPDERTGPPVMFAFVADKMTKAKDMDALNEAASFIREVSDKGHQDELTAKYETKKAELSE